MFTNLQRVGDRVLFEFVHDEVLFPWQMRPAYDTTFIQTMSFFVPTVLDEYLGIPLYKSAGLTCHTEVRSLSASLPVYGTYERTAISAKRASFIFHLYLDKDRTNLCCIFEETVAILSSEQWKYLQKKRSARRERLSQDVRKVQLATQPNTLGVVGADEVFLGPLHPQEETSRGIVTYESGFPRHPYHFGSGDHVNTEQTSNTILQFAHLIARRLARKLTDPPQFLGTRRLIIIREDLVLEKYFELGIPLPSKQ